MKKEIVFLGTGEAMASRCYNSCFAVNAGDEKLLVDAGGGNGILKQLKRANIAVEDLNSLFLTHTHTDHILGAVWLLRDIGQRAGDGYYDGHLHIYGHHEAISTLKSLCKLLFGRALLRSLEKSVVFCVVKDGDKARTSALKLNFFDIHSQKCKQFGVRIALNDGPVLTYLGDEPYRELNRNYAFGVDWLISEAFCLSSEADIFQPYKINHATALDAGLNAEKLKAGNLVIIHTEDSKLAQRKALYTAEAKRVFSGRVFVPDDLERLEIGTM